MRVLFVLHDFLPKHPAGTEIYTFEVARELKRRGHDVHIFATEKDIGRPNLTVHFREFKGLPIHELTNNLFYNDFRETWDYPHVVKTFGLLLDDLKPDVVHFMHLLYLSVGCVEEVARRGIPVIYTLHDYWLQCARYGQRIHAKGTICHDIVPEICGECLVDLKFRQTRMERAMAKGIANLHSRTGLDLSAPARTIGDLLKGRGKAGAKAGEPGGSEPSPERSRRAHEIADLVRERDVVLRERLLPVVYRFLAPSRFLRERFLEWGIPPEQIDYCRTGIDLVPFEGFERTRSDRLRVAFIGTPAPHKGVHVLLEAWGRLTPEERAKGQLEIYGGLEHNPGYIRKIQSLCESVGARLMGALKRSEVPGALARTDLLVVPSIWYENSPLIILEALATRTPILVSDLGGMAELVEPGRSGFRFKVDDSTDLARVLSRLLENPAELEALYPDDLEVKPVTRDGEILEELYAEALAALPERIRHLDLKILFALHGYPPELLGGTENTVRAQARGLVGRGHEVAVVAGSMDWEGGFRTTRDTDADPSTGRTYPIHRIHRDDLYFDHWQKSASPRVSRAFRDILREERPDLVHVQHWIRLSRDLVAVAAREGIPSVVTLHDLWTTCLLTFRVRPETTALCEEKLGLSPCLRCAGGVPPRTPWVTFEAGAIAFSERLAEIARELELARAIVTPSRAHAEAVERFLGRAPGSLEARVIPPGRELGGESALGCPPRPRDAAVIPDPGEAGKLVLGAWGHLDPIKGADLVLEAIRNLEQPSRVALHLAGGEVDAAFAARLREAARGLEVHFHGAFEVGELARHPVTRVHAMVSGSRAHESWGLVLDEAWHLGLPAILPDRGAFRDRVAGESGGLLYASGDAAALAGAIGRLLDEPELLAGLRAGIPPPDGIAPTVEQSVELESVYGEAVSAGPPEPPQETSLLDLVRARALEEWDRSLSRRSPQELGFEEPPS